MKGEFVIVDEHGAGGDEVFGDLETAVNAAKDWVKTDGIAVRVARVVALVIKNDEPIVEEIA